MTALSLALLFVPCGDERPERLLERSLRPTGLDVHAVVMQRDVRGDGTHRMIRMIRAKDGRMASLVLSPSAHEGTATVDDGVRVRTYVPRSGRVMEGPSTMESAEAAHVRMARATKNYRFSMGASESVAGRRAVVVVASPKHRGMPERRYFLDFITGYPLRLDIVTDGKPVCAFEVRKVTYGDIPENAFVLRTKGPIRLDQMPPPVPVATNGVGERLGFRPFLPRKLPMGLAIEETAMMRTGDVRMLAVRLTDGLVRATVYELPDRPDMDWGKDTRAADGIRILLGTDLPQPTRDALLDAFVRGRRLAVIDETETCPGT